MIGILFALFISVCVPISFCIYAVIKKRILPFVLGVSAFVGSQMLIRLPILQLLEANSVKYTMFSVTNPILFAIIIALSAGVVEETARFILMRYVLKERTWQTGLLFGAGHGGVEAVLFVGISALAMLFSTVGASYGGEFFIGGIERLFAMLLHIGLSMLVLRSVVEKRYILLFIAILIHGFVNSLVGIVPLFFTPNMALVVIEVVLAIIAIGLFMYNLYVKRKGVFQ